MGLDIRVVREKVGTGKTKSRENMGLLLNCTRELAMKDTKKNNVPKAFLTSVFTGKTGFQDSQVSETTGNV